ncbi:MAG: hypothetical protein ACR2QJ_17225 [Geminicoccaceae bacterium]
MSDPKPGLMVATERQVYDELDAAIMRAHGAGRLDMLATSYARGGTLYERQGETDAACFFWTQAYVLALDAGVDPLADAMHEKLAALGRMG